MNIAFITNDLIVGGGATYIDRKSRWLIDKGHNIIVISEGGIYANELHPNVNSFVIDHLSKIPFALTKKTSDKIQKQLSEILISKDIDIIEAYGPSAILYTALTYPVHKKNYLFNCLLEFNFNNSWILSSITKLLNNKGRYYTLTTQMSDYINKKCGVLLSPTIIPIPIGSVPNDTLSEKPYVLSVGRMSPDKLYLKYLMADFYYLHKNQSINKDIKLIAVGDGPTYEEMYELAESYNKDIGYKIITLTGTVIGKELDNLYKECMLYIGVGTTLLISASYSKATILGSGISNDNKYAWGFWGDDRKLDKNSIAGTSTEYLHRKSSYSEILKLALNDEDIRNSKGRVAFELFSEVYSINKIMTDWESQYRKLANYPLDNELIDYAQKQRKKDSFLRVVYSVYRRFK